ncbi:MAG: MBOAT family O-acyltransferase [Bacteroidia bacterium]
MLFNSFNFLIFFPLVTGLYFLLPHRFRWFMLLAASCIFYMFFIPEYILILIFTIVIDYYAGIYIAKTKDPKHRKRWLIASLIANIGVLAIFKYYNFFNANLEAAAHAIGWTYGIPALAIILPIGLSFHTFQAMSYTIEVYRGNQQAEKHFGIYALYVMYYPQLVAGPIERPQNVLHQFHEDHKYDYKNFADGLKLMAWGLFKKVVIADRLSVFVNQVFDHPESFPGVSMLIAAVFFSIQIYCDFSGYSDIALGASQTMGIKLMKNFDRPYFSKTISEFWKRWHISLSTWFKDYLYIPLGGNRVSKAKIYRNLFLTFLISGFWHGANWTFIIWGGLHGLYLTLGMATDQIRAKFRRFIGLEKWPLINKTIQAGIVFALVTLAWIFFRAKSFDVAVFMIKNIVVGVPEYVLNALTNPKFLWLEPLLLLRDQRVVIPEFGLIVVFVLLMESVHWIQRGGSARAWLDHKPLAFRWVAYLGLVGLLLFFGVYHDKAEFIYFQF